MIEHNPYQKDYKEMHFQIKNILWIWGKFGFGLYLSFARINTCLYFKYTAKPNILVDQYFYIYSVE